MTAQRRKRVRKINATSRKLERQRKGKKLAACKKCKRAWLLMTHDERKPVRDAAGELDKHAIEVLLEQPKLIPARLRA